MLIDGRSVYTPLFSGVFWDVQNVMLEDIDRIEVISGPGGTLWGANAVNGVINVITKTARDTEGALLSGGGGSYLKGFGNARYGGRRPGFVSARLRHGLWPRKYAAAGGSDADDRWSVGQGGFRGDWLPPSGPSVMLQGNFYDSRAAQVAPGDRNADGQT